MFCPLPAFSAVPPATGKKTVVPISDVLIVGYDHFDACPKCNHAPLETKTASGLSVGVAQLVSLLEKVFRR